MDEHCGAFEYDWRTRFRKPLTIVGTPGMTWGEAVRLTQVLRRDTTSQVAAALEGWDYPVSRETLATLDLFDLTLRANSDRKKGTPTPHGGRPFKVTDTKVTKHGVAPQTAAEVSARLRPAPV